MSVGGPPGITAEVEVFSVKDNRVTFQMKEEDAAYFKSKSTGALAFWPNRTEPPVGAGGEGPHDA